MGLLNHGPAPSCPALPTLIADASPIACSLTLKELGLYIAGICMGFTSLVSGILIFLHATHLSRPAEQTKIMRIIALVPTFALIYFINISLGTSATYLVPWGTVCESIALASFFFLVCDYLSPTLSGQSSSFDFLGSDQVKDSAAPPDIRRLKKTRNLACQSIFVSILVAAITDITEATGSFCSTSNNIHFAHIWLTIARAISTTVAVVAIIKFIKDMHVRLGSHRIVLKLVAFKLIVGLDFIQTLAFSIASGYVHPTGTLSYLGLTVYLPSIIFGVEMAIFSVAFHFVYSYRAYIIQNPSGMRYQGGPLGISAVGKAFNLFDILREIIYRF